MNNFAKPQQTKALATDDRGDVITPKKTDKPPFFKKRTTPLYIARYCKKCGLELPQWQTECEFCGTDNSTVDCRNVAVEENTVFKNQPKAHTLSQKERDEFEELRRQRLAKENLKQMLAQIDKIKQM